ncbi:MAG: hypothetical protein EOO01_38725 [Chitinophagaceae bacterium]|nr:MAG: hypothetical protein EOO01_38725 [Chitinophagaceae bacterium]
MKKIFTTIVICISLFSCTSKEKETTAENIKVAREYMRAVETKDAAKIEFLLADNYVGYGPSVDDSTTKKEALQAWKFNSANLYETYEYTRHKELAINVPEGEAKGDWVLNWAYLTIKYKDGRGPINLWVNVVYRMEFGKIVQSRTFYNEADALRQLGYSIEAPTGE